MMRSDQHFYEYSIVFGSLIFFLLLLSLAFFQVCPRTSANVIKCNDPEPGDYCPEGAL